MICDKEDLEQLYPTVKLGDLIETLEKLLSTEKEVSIDSSFHSPHSYRGYYKDLGLEPSGLPTNGVDLLQCLNDVLNTEQTGWKGGEFLMHEGVDCYIAQEGSTGQRLIGFVKNFETDTYVSYSILTLPDF